MRPKATLRRTAIVVALIYLALSTLFINRSVGHAFEHRHHSHTAQHASPICEWVCTASLSVHSTGLTLGNGIALSCAVDLLYSEPFISKPACFSFHIRPPPPSLL